VPVSAGVQFFLSYWLFRSLRPWPTGRAAATGKMTRKTARSAEMLALSALGARDVRGRGKHDVAAVVTIRAQRLLRLGQDALHQRADDSSSLDRA
jgi:hypothetical protein